MKEKILSTVCIILLFLGFLSMFFLAGIPEKKEIKISEINKNFLNKNLLIKGKIEKIKEYKDYEIITIRDSSGKINVFMNEKIREILKNNATIIVSGKIQEYKNELQINADKIELIR